MVQQPKLMQRNAIFSNAVDLNRDRPTLFLGFDLSLTRSSVVGLSRAVVGRKVILRSSFGTSVNKNLKGISEGALLLQFGEWLSRILSGNDGLFVVVGVEGYSFGSAHNRFQESLGAVFRYRLSEWTDRSHSRTFCCAIPPVCIKKFFTDNHRADKKMMMAEARRKKFKPASDDEADAFALSSFLAACADKISGSGVHTDYINQFMTRIGLDKMRFY